MHLLLPIGAHCHVAKCMKENGHRSFSYPFDWLSCSIESISKLFLKILTVESIDDFCNTLFSHENNDLMQFNGNNYFHNREYNIGFIHDDIETILEKYKRRFHRLYNHFMNAEKVTLIFANRWTYHDHELYNLLKELEKYRSNINLIAINALEFDIKLPNVISYTIPIPIEITKNKEWTEEKTKYDKTIYFFDLKTLLNKVISNDIFNF